MPRLRRVAPACRARTAVRPFPSIVLPILLLLGLVPVTATSGPRPPDGVLSDGWTPEGYIDPASGEAQRVQVTMDATGAPLAVWAGRPQETEPFEIRYTRFDGTAWSAVTRAFAPNDRQNELPRLSRAPDGTLWLAWLRLGDAATGNKTLFSVLMAARYADGAWSEPETVAVDLALPRREEFPSEFAVLGVSRDEAWIVFARDPGRDPFSLIRDLEASHRTAAGWAAPALVSDAGLSETRPELTFGPGGQPVVFFGFANSPSVLWAKRWTGSTWEQGSNDALTTNAIFEHAVQPDTLGAVRMVAFVRETGLNGEEDRVREYVWNDTGFHPGPILLQAAVVEGGGSEPPDWQGLSLSSGATCVECLTDTPPLYRPMWIDFAPGGTPRVFSALRRADEYAPLDVAGTTFESAEAYPNTAYDGVADRWYAVWVGAPSPTGVRRAKFAWTQTFAGDLGIGANLVLPDTSRVEIVCTGDATGREFRVYRLEWETSLPPLAPPIPDAAVEVAGSPFPGPCPLTFDDLPGPGRYFYYAELVPEGTFPAAYARSSQPIVIEGGGGPGPDGIPASTAFLAPYPMPSFGGAVTLPFDLNRAASDVTITIHDLRGRAVRRYALGALAAGRYRGQNAGVWDLKDDDGHLMVGGVYFAQLLVDGEPVSPGRRLVVVPTSVTF